MSKTTLSLIVHDVDDVSRQLELGGYFFGDIKKEGVVLHDTGRITLAEAKEKTPDERLFDLLKKAYIDARYSTKYAVTEEELRVIADRVCDLRDRVERLCRGRIHEVE